MVERQAKSLCYNCDEIYSINHQYKTLFWVELKDPWSPIIEPDD